MKTLHVESDGDKQKIYRSLVVEPRKLNILGNELAIKVISELSKQPQCAMDIARKLKQHEQKIYYHLRNLEKAGMVKLIGTESRYGMIAKIYDVVSPVIAAKLYEDGHTITSPVLRHDPSSEVLLKPFIVNGKLNAKIIIGNPHPHGNYGATARDSVYMVDLLIFLGTFVREFESDSYKIDVEVSEDDLKENLIIIGSPKINTIADMINPHLPLYFNKEKSWAIESKLSGKTYDYDYDSVIVKIKNPFNRKKEVLLLAGIRSAALRVAVKAFVNHTDEIIKGNTYKTDFIAKVVTGIDKDGDGIIDEVKFLE